jgi:HPt (histidine-containing phosphotransfer) domain-containing protein
MDRMTESAHPVSLDELLNRCLGELEFAAEILRSFLDSCPPQLEQIRHDIEGNATESLAKRVHRLKGTAATVAAGPLRRSLEKLESLARDEVPDQSARLHAQLDDAEQQFRRVSAWVQHRMSAPPGAGA